MPNTSLHILLSLGLLASGIGPGITVSGEAPTVCGTAPADTTLALGSDVEWNGAALWSRRGPRPSAMGSLLTTPDFRTGRFSTAPQWPATTTTGPVAESDLWGANGNVLDMVRSGNTLYIAGSFRSVGENTGGFVPIDAHTGEPLRPFPKVAGSVRAVVPDSSGGWYIGGEFTAVGGKPRSCLAQIRPDGSVSDWNPSVSGSPGYIDPPSVSSIVVLGSRVYVGGGFREIGGLPRENLGCVDARTGAVLDWNAGTHVDGFVYSLVTHDNSLIVGGRFTSIGGQPRSYLASVDATTGTVLPWAPNPDYAVLALLVREDTLFAGGQFGWISGSTHPLLAAIDVHTAQLLPFDADVSGIYLEHGPTPRVSALALTGDTLYAAGNFTRIGGLPRTSLAALSATTGIALAWTPDSLGPRYEGFPPRLCAALAVQSELLYIGGLFETVGGVSHPFVAALNRETGAVTTWDPRPDLSVGALAVKGDTVYVGGIFSLVGEWQHRAGLAAIDLTTGAVKPWNPNPDGSICTAIAVDRDRVFVSGNFANIGGQPKPRYRLAALDTLNGEVVDWNPGANSVADAMMLVGDTLYVGGEFTEVGGQPRNYLASIDVRSGALTDWNPAPNYIVLAMARSDQRLYFGGLFYVFDGKLRRGVAAVDAASGAVTAWNPGTDNYTVDALLANGNTVYVGGGFGEIGGQIRKSLAALDATTGQATAWNPQPAEWGSPPRVRALALHDGLLYVGGDFGTIGGQPRICLAALDTLTGLATDWDPGADGLVWSLAADASNVFAGGGFTRAGGLPSAGLVAFSFPVEQVPTPASFHLSQCVPNPAQSSAIVRFTLPGTADVTLTVFDMQGRRVATPIDHVLESAGPHDVAIRSAGWKPGVYLYRLEAGGRSATRKMIVLN